MSDARNGLQDQAERLSCTRRLVRSKEGVKPEIVEPLALPGYVVPAPAARTLEEGIAAQHQQLCGRLSRRNAVDAAQFPEQGFAAATA